MADFTSSQDTNVSSLPIPDPSPIHLSQAAVDRLALGLSLTASCPDGQDRELLDVDFIYGPEGLSDNIERASQMLDYLNLSLRSLLHEALVPDQLEGLTATIDSIQGLMQVPA